ncbi:MAG: hypothetical protein II530_03125 [Bacteroidaceae bacterium]|nr:hypothetical protein [Bacteroidaceae bacterium]
MEGFLKNLGIILIVLGAIGLIVSFYVGGLSSINGFTAGMLLLMVVGLVLHIIMNKKYVD